MKVLFIRNYYDTYSDCQLNKKGGIVDEICRMMNYHQRKTVKNVILGVKEALDNDVEYQVERKKYTNEARRKIQQGSYEEHLLTTFLEKGNSYLSSTQVFNASVRAPANLPRIGITAIYNAIKRTNHAVLSTTSIPQNTESNLIHRQARYKWDKQLSSPQMRK